MDGNFLFTLGVKYDLGNGFKQNFDKAREYYEQSASTGNAKALNNLGVLYDHGEGVEQNYVKAKSYYEKAIEQGSIIALFNLGELYYYGKGVKQDLHIAREYYEHAAAKGHIKAGECLNYKGRDDIIHEISRRKIKYLIHFTHIDNLESIIASGFIPRNILDSDKYLYKHNDEYRMEGRTDCTCFSIEYPNQYMMSKYRGKWLSGKNYYERMCVIRLNILDIFKSHQGDIYFTPFNSASSCIREDLSLCPKKFASYNAFKNIFLENNPDTRHRYTRTEKRLPDYIPTHHQAEVLISNIIKADYIDSVYFEAEESYKYFLKIVKNQDIINILQLKIDDFYFGSRDDIKWEER